MSDAAAHPAVRAECPVVSEALLASASAQVRNLATLGGNLLQRTRCGYFRDPGAPCNKREPGAGCPAIDGQNRFHAVLGGSEHCIATYAGDFANALLVLDATRAIVGPGGERTIPLAELHRSPGDTPAVETQLEPGELILSIDVPTGPPRGARTTSRSATGRASSGRSPRPRWRSTSTPDGSVRDVRIAVGGVATTPWRLPQVEAALRGEPSPRRARATAAARAADGATAHGRNAYKLELIRRTVARALIETGALA